MAPVSTSVVVPTRNRAHLLPGLLAALDAQDEPCYDVIVVDDASEDETGEILQAWAGVGRLALRLDAPSGSYAARNRGWRVAQGTIVAFTDDDCLPEPGWLSGLIRAMDDTSVVGVQGVTLAEPGEVTPFTHQIAQRGAGPPYRTCNIAYRRSILEWLGGFDDTLRWYADNIFGLRASQIGTIAFAANAVVHHPPRPRTWRSRADWLARFEADRRHRAELRRVGAERLTVPRGALPVILWVLRPLLKQSLAHARYLLHHPAAYRRAVRPMIKEKWELLLALREAWRTGLPDPAAAPVCASGAAQQETPPLVSVVVVTRDRPQLLAGTLAALGQQTRVVREVIVVDHADSPATRLAAEKAGARYVTAPTTTLAGARQAGVLAARGEIVAFTDDDCLPAPDWLEALVAAFSRRPALHGVQGQTRAEPGELGRHAVQVTRANPLYHTCNIAYRRAALERAGGFDLRFRSHFEDTALAARVLRYGPIGFEPAALVTHRAMQRRCLDRNEWRTLLEDEWRLARHYSSFYRRTRGPGFLSTVIIRWLLGSPAKVLVRELPRGARDPAGYARLLWLLVRERRDLLSALVDVIVDGKGNAL